MIVDIVFGFLGAGKTTFITRVLKEWGSKEKTVVLVNEFGEVGIDGELLAAEGGNVVEMPSGCICCTLQADFRAQLLEISRAIRPERVIIEPTGVATIAQVRSIIAAQLFENTIRQINDILIADATGFMGLYKANRHFVESQVENADIVLLNKCDKVDRTKAMVTRSAISAINPEITVLTAEFGAVDWADYHLALSAAPRYKRTRIEDEHHRANDGVQNLMAEAVGQGHPHFDEEEDALGYESYGCVFGDLSFDRSALEAFFRELNKPTSGAGEIVRAKGVFRLGDRAILMELASGEFSFQPMGQLKQSKVSIIGKGLNREMIGAALERCVAKDV
ncbi:MAG: GTP-binding protein [Desulfobacterales bacterium]|jgi:G3E family GTPase|nr:GTP-binding protein [Desulfobacterales bacterium]